MYTALYEQLGWALRAPAAAQGSLEEVLEEVASRLPPILDWGRPNASSRAAVESCRPHTAEGVLHLDREPDVTQTLLLADGLRMDELQALHFLREASLR
ncbi:hypothetical protein H632_c3072p0, partial [Helicosporidium sp. ATCC 50920]